MDEERRPWWRRWDGWFPTPGHIVFELIISSVVLKAFDGALKALWSWLGLDWGVAGSVLKWTGIGFLVVLGVVVVVVVLVMAKQTLPAALLLAFYVTLASLQRDDFLFRWIWERAGVGDQFDPSAWNVRAFDAMLFLGSWCPVGWLWFPWGFCGLLVIMMALTRSPSR